MVEPVKLRPSPELFDGVTNALEEVLSMKLGMAESDSEYDLHYLSQKLASCSFYMEKISDIQLNLTKLNIQVIRAQDTLRLEVGRRTRELKGSVEYGDQPREFKTPWIREQLGGLVEVEEAWSLLKKMVSEVKEAVGERVATIKRLDSDIRLHQRLLEAKVSSGASSPDGSLKFPSVNEGELNLD